MNTPKKFSLLALVVITIFSFVYSVHADTLSLGSTTLRVGSTGQYVTNLQTVLNNYTSTSLTIDGDFGPKTDSAVVIFQRAHGLTPDGLVGNFTKQILNSIQLVTTSNACTPSTNGSIPALEVTDPLSGNTYHIGNTIEVAWKDCHTYQGNVSVNLIDSQGQSIPIANNIPIGNLQYQFAVPASYTNGSSQTGATYLIGSQNPYTISVSIPSASGTTQGTSGSFTILPNNSPAIPFIGSLSPLSGSVGTLVTISGTGFSATNTILFGGGPVDASSFDGGTMISFAVPNSVGADCQAGTACPQYERLITPGSYSVSVRNIDGTSNTISFTVLGTSQ